MASVRPHKWRNGRSCRDETTPPSQHGDDCRCKVLSWRVFWRQPDGSKRSEVFSLKRDADAKKAEVESTRNRGTYIDPHRGREPFGEMAEKWAATREWKASTESSWTQTVKRLEPLWDLPLAAVDKLALESCRTSLAKTYTRRVVRNTMLRALAVARYAYENGYVGRDPTIGVDPSPKRRADDPSEKVTPDQVPTRAEALAMLAGAPDGWRAAVALGLGGCRAGEMLGMSRDRLALDQRKVTIDRQAQHIQGEGVQLVTVKNETNRTIVVPQLVAVELRRHLRDHPDEMLFPGPSNGLTPAVTFYKDVWPVVLANAGLSPKRFKYHALRHFCASNLLAEGASITAVAGFIGDTVATTQSTYAHWLRDDREVPATVLDRILAPAEAGASRMPHAVGDVGE